MSDRYTIIARCDGGFDIGFGHVSRCLALARAFRQEGHEVVFATRGDAVAVKRITESGFSVQSGSADRAEALEPWLRCIVAGTRADALVLDVRDDLPVDVVREMRALGVTIASLDDPTPRRLVSDLVFYPPIPQVSQWDWSGFTGARLAGWEWVVLRPEFALARHQPRSGSGWRVLVTMGGSDPAGMTQKVLEGLRLLRRELDVTVVLGPGFATELSPHLLAGTRNLTIRCKRNVSNMVDEISRADLAVASFGVTAYELAAMRVPMVLLDLTPDHSTSASAMVAEGLARDLGVHSDVSPEMIADAVDAELSQHRGSTARPARGPDGNGAMRVAGRILDAIRDKARSGVTAVIS